MYVVCRVVIAGDSGRLCSRRDGITCLCETPGQSRRLNESCVLLGGATCQMRMGTVLQKLCAYAIVMGLLNLMCRYSYCLVFSVFVIAVECASRGLCNGGINVLWFTVHVIFVVFRSNVLFVSSVNARSIKSPHVRCVTTCQKCKCMIMQKLYGCSTL